MHTHFKNHNFYVGKKGHNFSWANFVDIVAGEALAAKGLQTLLMAAPGLILFTFNPTAVFYLSHNLFTNQELHYHDQLNFSKLLDMTLGGLY